MLGGWASFCIGIEKDGFIRGSGWSVFFFRIDMLGVVRGISIFLGSSWVELFGGGVCIGEIDWVVS